MKIGLYGLPCSGKSYLLEKLQACSWNHYRVLRGSELLFQKEAVVTDFRNLPTEEKVARRRQLARSLQSQKDVIMDGHHSFGHEVVFTQEDGELYDVFCYLYLPSEILAQRMAQSEKNQKYLTYDLEGWQQREISALRQHCHEKNKDFYVIDYENHACCLKTALPLDFIKAIQQGYSVVESARGEANSVLTALDHNTKHITLTDGDKTLTEEDTSLRILGLHTTLFDGNFYTGYQQWQQFELFEPMAEGTLELLSQMKLRQSVLDRCSQSTAIVTSGHPKLWEHLSRKLGFSCVSGAWVCADGKYFLTKFLQEAGLKVTSFGDSMNDFFMLKQADQGYLLQKEKGTVSRSLRTVSLEGLHYV